MEGIKNLIIDFGGVIINLTRNRCVEAFENFGVPDVRDRILNSKDLFMQIEMGTITSAEFRDGIRHLTHQHLTDQQIDAAWIAMLDDVPAYKLDLLMELVGRHVVEHGDPGGIDLLVGQVLTGQMADTVAELGGGDGSHLYLHKEVFTVQYPVAHIGHAEVLECFHTTVTGQVDDHPTEIYNQVLNSFHTHR